jgi:hypothetical protein
MVKEEAMEIGITEQEQRAESVVKEEAMEIVTTERGARAEREEVMVTDLLEEMETIKKRNTPMANALKEVHHAIDLKRR